MMDLPMALMLVCVALTEEAETPLGHVAAFGPAEDMVTLDTRAGTLESEAQQSRRGMVDTIADNVRLLEYSEKFTTGPESEQIYSGVRKLAEQWEER